MQAALPPEGTEQFEASPAAAAAEAATTASATGASASASASPHFWFQHHQEGSSKLHLPEKSEMQKRKETGVSHIRYREVSGIMQAQKRHEIYAHMFQHNARVEVSIPAQPLAGRDLLKTMWATGLKMMLDIRDMAEDARSAGWGPLLSRMPSKVFEKFPELVPQTASSLELIKVLIQLMSHHRGEIVELCKETIAWHQKPGPCPDMPSIGGPADWQNEQFLCYPKPVQSGLRKRGKGQKGQPLAAPAHPPATPGGKWEFGKIPLAYNSRLPYPDATPDWGNQRHRFYCPAAQPLAEVCHFERQAHATNLGMLFAVLGKRFDADTIYQYYLSQRVLAVKQTRDNKPALQRFWTGWGLESTKEDLVNEFCQLLRLPPPVPDSGLLDFFTPEAAEQLRGATRRQLEKVIEKNAMAYVARLILEDTRPPWLQQPRADTGTNFNWLVVKHTFLCWPAEVVKNLGEEVYNAFVEECDNRGARFLGVVAQPLYSCTRMKWFHEDGQPLAAGAETDEFSVCLPCGKRAAMTPLLQLKEYQKHRWVCEDCAPELGMCPQTLWDAPNRVFLAWPLVEKKRTSLAKEVPSPSPWQGTVTPMKVKAIEFICEAPPNSWQWPTGALETLTQPLHATKIKGLNCTRFIFKGDNSSSLWASSQAFEPVWQPAC